MSPRTFRAAPVTAAALLAFGLVFTAPAVAAEPQRLDEQVTDLAGVLDGEAAEEIQETFDDVSAETGQVVFVAFVPDFGGASSGQWATETAELSGLGANNTLLAVAIDEQAYGRAVHSSAPFSESALDQMVTQDVVPALSGEDWAQAAIAFGSGVGELASGDGGASPPGTSADEDDDLDDAGSAVLGFGALLTLGLIVVVGLVLFVSWRNRRRAGSAGRSAQLPPGHPLTLPTEELATRAGQALLAADDAVRSSEEELGFAQAQFGLQATDRFTAALAEAKTKTRRAFSLRKRIEDGSEISEEDRRRAYADILALTDEVGETLAAQAEHFEELRDLQARAPQALDEMEQRATEVEGQIGSARAQLSHLATRYPAAALSSVSDNPDEALALLASARESVATGRELVAEDDRQTAVTHVQIAEEAIGQASTLLREVHAAGELLASASERLDAALASITSDVRDAERLAPDDPGILPHREEADAAIEQGRQAKQGGDPLAALQRLEDAEAAIDAALAPARSEEENRRRAQSQLQGRLGRLDARLRSVSSYVSTHRGSVGHEARTRLSEAQRLTDEARAAAERDPVVALELVSQAERLVADAQSIAQQDRDQWSGGFGSGGGFGGGFGDRRGGVDLGSLVLGGILGGMGGRGGGHRGGWGGGFGGGGGGFGGGGFRGGGGGFGGGGFGGGGGRF